MFVFIDTENCVITCVLFLFLCLGSLEKINDWVVVSVLDFIFCFCVIIFIFCFFLGYLFIFNVKFFLFFKLFLMFVRVLVGERE